MCARECAKPWAWQMPKTAIRIGLAGSLSYARPHCLTCAHGREAMVVMRSGWAVSQFQASAQASRMVS
jgi:hypothetical protein